MDKLLKNKWFILILICSWVFVLVTIASKCSFLFRMNDWYDPNCYYTVAKSMKNGAVLYRDIYEQKGPYLYFVHVFACLISTKNYLGIYFVELLYGYVVGIFGYKILGLYIDSKKRRLIWLALFLTCYYSSPAFASGDSVEEMIIPMIMVSMYFALKAYKNNSHMLWYESLLSGLFLGITIMSKFIDVGFFGAIALLIFIFDMKDKRFGKGFRHILYFILGLLLSFGPVLIYFGVNNAIGDFFTAYFYNNLFLYSKSEKTGIFYHLGCSLLGYVISYAACLPIYALIVVGLIYGIKNGVFKTRLGAFIILSYVITEVIIYAGGRMYVYYGLPTAVFGIFGVVALDKYSYSWKKLPEFSVLKPLKFVSVYLGLLLVWMMAFNEDAWCMFRPIDTYAQFEMKEIIDDYKENNKEKEVTMLNYDFLDCGLYLLTDIDPNCKYFVGLNINLPELKETQDEFLRDGKVTFVVTMDETLDGITSKYDLVYQKDAYYEWATHTYYLYQLKA